MLFTPKKFDEDWTRIHAISLYAMSLGFALSAIGFAWTDEVDLFDRIIAVLGFILASIVCRALGEDQWKKASKMRADGLSQSLDRVPR